MAHVAQVEKSSRPSRFVAATVLTALSLGSESQIERINLFFSPIAYSWVRILYIPLIFNGFYYVMSRWWGFPLSCSQNWWNQGCGPWGHRGWPRLQEVSELWTPYASYERKGKEGNCAWNAVSYLVLWHCRQFIIMYVKDWEQRFWKKAANHITPSRLEALQHLYLNIDL